MVLRICFCSKKTDFSGQTFKSCLGIQYGTFFVERKRKLVYSTYPIYVELYYLHFQKKITTPCFAK
jgi:hypothetical protein